ncbi:hypothetical protein AKO1_002660, partial [Acrasis kona]
KTYTGITISAVCPSACPPSKTTLNVSTNPKLIQEEKFTWQFQGSTSYPGILINSQTVPPFEMGTYYISYESDLDVEVMIVSQGYEAQVDPSWEFTKGENTIIKAVDLTQGSKLFLLSPIALPSSLTSEQAQINQLSNANCEQKEHVVYAVYVSPVNYFEERLDYKQIQKTHQLLSKQYIDTCKLYEKLSRAIFEMSIEELQSLDVQKDIEYTVRIMVFGGRYKEPIAIADPVRGILIHSKPQSKAGITNVPVVSSVVLFVMCIFGFGLALYVDRFKHENVFQDVI